MCQQGALVLTKVSKLGDPTLNPNFWGIFFGILGFFKFDPWILHARKREVSITLHVDRTFNALSKNKKQIGGL